MPGSGFRVHPEQRLERGAILTLPGTVGRLAFIVVSGCLTLRERLRDGTARTAGFRVPGELVGLESWARTARPYELSAAAPSVVCRLTLPRSGQNRIFLERLLEKCAAQIDQAMQPWPGLPAIERVAAFVEDFLHRSQIRGSAGVGTRLPMTRAEIGSYLGLAEETVVRALGDLRQSGRLDVHGKRVRLA